MTKTIPLPESDAFTLFVNNQPVTEFDPATAGVSGGFQIEAQPRGYWSKVVTLYVRRDFEGKWTYSLSHSSGGRDSRAVASDLEAGQNFAHAILAITGFAADHLDDADVVAALEAGYQARRAEIQKSEDEARAKRDARVAADPALGMAKAAGLLAGAFEIAKNKRNVTIRAYLRGHNDRYVTVTVRATPKKSVTWGDYGVSQKRLVECLAACSVNSCVFAAE